MQELRLFFCMCVLCLAVPAHSNSVKLESFANVKVAGKVTIFLAGTGLCHGLIFTKQQPYNRAMLQVYNEFQIKQLTRLIEVTRTELPKPERQKVMNMITIDAHSRDVVENIINSGAAR